MIKQQASFLNRFHANHSGFIYEMLGRMFRNATDWRFMNYGFSPEDDTDFITLKPEDEAERFPAQLYDFVATRADLKGKEVLDIGSGRGGGASYVHRYLGPKSTTGMDFAESAVNFCRKVYADIDGLTYTVGNAMDIPFADGSFDAVTNVESSHCYPDKAKFFSEVYRVLRPGGYFLYADFTPVQGRPHAGLVEVGFHVEKQFNITANVARALELDNARRKQQIKDRVPFGLRKLAHVWGGTEKSDIFEEFREGERDYFVFTARKPDPENTAT